MRFLQALATFSLLAAAPACALIDDTDADCTGGKCDGTAGGTCPDKRYGDGVCDTSLDCATPDIDCFYTFKTDDEAAIWYGKFEEKIGQESGRPPRAILSSTDPRFPKIRDLLDRGWKAFSENRPVGDLAGLRPGLVFVEDSSVNAFVAPDLDLQHAGFAVMVHTGLLEMDASDDAMLGLMMHELQHAIGLHVIPAVKDSFQRFYVAPADKEPIGRNQNDDAQARAAGRAWIGHGREVGPSTNVELGGLPLGGDLQRVLREAIQAGMQMNPTACQASLQQFTQIGTDIAAATDPVSGALALPASMKTRITAALASLRDQCLAGYTKSFVEIVATIAGATPQQIDASLTPEDRALVTGRHVVDAIAALTEDRRAKMRAVQAKFEADSYRPWSALRYFSTEEDADDTSVPVLRGANLDPIGLGTFLDVFLGDQARAACRAVIDSGQAPPYGVDLVDDHHGTCFRVYHIGAYAKATAKTAKLSTHTARPAAVAPPKRLLPPTLDEYVMH